MQKGVIITGRFQGFSIAHAKLIEKAQRENPGHIVIVGIVEGVKSSSNIDKNPFTYEEREQYITKIMNSLHIKPLIIKVTNAYLPDIVELLKEKYDIQVTKLICGSDRVNGYIQQGLEQLGVKVESIERNSDDDNENDRIKSASGTKVRQALKNNDFEAFRYLIPEEIDEDTARDTFNILRNAMKNKSIAITESVILSGITHIEDLDVDDFIYWLKNFYNENILAIQKLDGTFNMSVVKENDSIHFARLSKKQDIPFDHNMLPKSPIYNALRGACLALHDDKIQSVFLDYMDNGDAIDIEVLYGTQPNSIRYNLDMNYLALLRFIRGKTGLEADQILADITNELVSHKVTINNDVYYYDWNTEKISYATESEEWGIALPETITAEHKRLYNVENDLAVLEKWLEEPNEIISDITNLQAISTLLTTVPKEERDKYKLARDTAYEQAREYKLNIKKQMVETILKGIDFKIGGRTQEGLVIRDTSNNTMTKLVDREGFTKANQTNWYYMEMAGDGMKINGVYQDGVTQKFFKTIANKLNIPLFTHRSQVFKKIRTGNGDIKENIDSYLISRNYNPPKQVDDILILIKQDAKRAMEEIVKLKNDSSTDDKLNEFSKARTKNSLGLIYDNFKRLISCMESMNIKSDLDDSDNYNLVVDFIYCLFVSFTTVDDD